MSTNDPSASRDDSERFAVSAANGPYAYPSPTGLRPDPVPRMRPSRREVVARLAGAQKSNRGAAAYSRWVNRPLGRQIAASAYLAGLTPNAVTAISAACTGVGIAVLGLLRPSWYTALIVVAALVLGYAFDSADGQVARLRGGGSPAGEWIDHVVDCAKTSTLHLVVAVAWFRFYSLRHAWLLLIPLSFAVVAAVFFFALILVDMLRRIHRAGNNESSAATASVNPGEPAPILRSLIVLPNDYGLLCLTFALFPLHKTFTVVYTVLLAGNALFLVAGCVRWFAELEALPRPRSV